MNPVRILLTTTSYQDIPGAHHALLESTGIEIVRERGPLGEAKMLELVGEFDAILCGDDQITAAVLDKAAPRLKILSKYGIGVDKIDVAIATEMGIPLAFCPGVNHTTVTAKNCIITPHIGSRTYESVQRQAMMAAQNLLHLLRGEKPLAQVNTVNPPTALL